MTNIRDYASEQKTLKILSTNGPIAVQVHFIGARLLRFSYPMGAQGMQRLCTRSVVLSR